MQAQAVSERPSLDLAVACAHDFSIVLTLLAAFDVRIDSSASAPAQCSLLLANAANYAHELSKVLARGAGPVVVCLADGEPSDLAAAMEQGAEDAVLGTCAPTEIVVRLRAAIRRATRRAPNVIRVAGVEIEPEKRLVRRGAKEVTLSATECALLLSVVRREGNVVSAETLAQEIWGKVTPVANVHTYVSYLRRKVDDPACKSIVQTIRGLGYALAQ